MPLLGVDTKAKPLGTFRPPAQDLDVQHVRIQGDRGVVAGAKKLTSAMELVMTMEGASTLTVKVRDYSRTLLRSNITQTTSKLMLDNIEYSLVKVSHVEDEITLIFEETAVNLMRQYDKPKKANRDNTTRAQFIRGMVNEVKERRIPFECPELTEKQTVAAASAGTSPTILTDPALLSFRLHGMHGI